MTAHPYQDLEDRAFWSTAVARRHALDIERLWQPKFRMQAHQRIVTYGSCFAQHIGQGLRRQGFHWFNAEPAPAGLHAESERQFNYGVFSARTGNIYTASLLLQWVDWALGERSPPDEVWEVGGRIVDPFRPRIEPSGFASVEEMRRSRELTIEMFRLSIEKASFLVFTLGLTESWVHRTKGHEYPMCPGTVAGEFDPEAHAFVNQDYDIVKSKLIEALRKLKRRNPKLRVLLTVSPVPLTATLSGSHVLVANTGSKAILRAVAGSVAEHFRFVDYFPAFEIIQSAPFRSMFFEPNQRSVHPAGVEHVMRQFFEGIGAALPEDATAASEAPASPADAVCEEQLLNAFAKAR